MIKSHYGRVRTNNAWLFRFFNYAIEEAVRQRFLDRVRTILGTGSRQINQQDIAKAIRDGALMKKLKECYRSYIGRDRNVTSLATYHGPAHRKHVLNEVLFGVSPQTMFQMGFYLIGNARMTGYLLTGDIDLNDPRRSEFESHFRNYFPSISRVQLPHHGSKRNWNASILDLVRDPAIWIVSAGIGNKYGHPSPEVIQAIKTRGDVIVWCNEFAPVSEDYDYYPATNYPATS